ncbi:MAG: 16S rRNA (cytidine(1402)-2'-O)-methyltransferase [Desulfobacterales bacterium]|uniref:Ribosomal RNA small subunit methyltransferase I n=1 Tax=Candidatus Desulfaltia bathyphila TaxID=2841697 RepID=A0A8J6N5E8_9BACT|nr:16S rRNA (cytidine(1402)-2'-O)-methyltransferase [Candidatus Desulfaltia bathyphila]MBL7194765.1 16S rRNA (cytidine(1402)-2'-O)-methyltransferase [Desulfobacterales bacterium]MBL7207925.1 16S rRNA (cytidine(1402)-2'-O)-methyltransferase [Desulfobacterales bacterium]
MPLNSPTNNPEQPGKKGDLYVIATPIGNREDITLRALNVLGRVDLVAAEDTRHTLRLLSHYNIKGRLISYHEHNERERTKNLLDKLNSGLSVALVSNAGTPTVSDPGYQLIKTAIERDIRVIPIPGVSAAVTAISVSGMPTDSFVFVGFLAKKKGKRFEQLRKLAFEQRTIIFYESPRRIQTLLEEIILNIGDRKGVLCREMTKIHEEFVRGNLSDILRALKKRSSIKGECTLLVTGEEENKDVSMEKVRREIKKRLASAKGSLSDITKEIAKKYNLPKNRVYDEALKIKKENQYAKP